jgi:hypothetical protein
MRMYFSAAASAIRFLTSLPNLIRLYVRRLNLLEDRASISMPSTHGRGLIPFCREKPRLRIQRSVDLWRAVMVGCTNAPYTMSVTGRSEWDTFDPCVRPKRWFNAYHLSTALAPWVVEANDLVASGMPRGSFSLDLHGDSSRSDLFEEFVLPDAMRQDAADEAIKYGHLQFPNLPAYRRIQNEAFILEGFPDAMRNLSQVKEVNRWAPIQCTFNPGRLEVPDPLAIRQMSFVHKTDEFRLSSRPFHQWSVIFAMQHPDIDPLSARRLHDMPLLNPGPFWVALREHRAVRNRDDDRALDARSFHDRWEINYPEVMNGNISWTPDPDATYLLPWEQKIPDFIYQSVIQQAADEAKNPDHV